MSHGITPVDNDGPVMRWIIKHGQRAMLNLNDQQKFADNIAEFRHARDNKLPLSTNMMPIRIGDLGGNIQFTVDSFAYHAAIEIYQLSLVERLSCEDEVRSLKVDAKQNLSAILQESLIGAEVDQLVSLPTILQSIIASRTIEKITEFLDWSSFHINTEPWS